MGPPIAPYGATNTIPKGTAALSYGATSTSLWGHQQLPMGTAALPYGDMGTAALSYGDMGTAALSYGDTNTSLWGQ